ncbi:phosphotransferase family protein [Nocardioides euryhalodurans]|uniref:Aminoglycoside phosphotransferase family protein n=1 Tax=Nocardioides euryhalodurans TaxID=2518370 RepID=A0A4P7GMD8_9ACTN|nr:aminoglycoside phosphotransferase family protein [Nocardioides euryhalodurans]QBR93173.1 aminoglycoside phosphotransferase family protein [Nocardioides euryhalodurans]
MVAGVVLVALLHEGQVLVVDGRLPEVEVDEDADDRFPTALERVGADVYLAPVLRLGVDRFLDVVGCRSLPVPHGTWVAPADLADTEVAELLGRTLREREEPPPLRPPWFLPGWYDEVETWVDEQLSRAGRPRTGVMVVHRVWSISAVLRVPTGSGVLWFKAPCDLFGREAAIHRVLARHFPDDVPVLVAADEERGWTLMEAMRGAGESDRSPGAAAALATRWAEVQLASLDVVDELREAGGLVRDAAATLAALHRVLSGSPELGSLDPDELAAVRAVVGRVEDLVRELWDCGLPDTLCHGDLHLGNVAYDGHELRVFDLTDCCIGHPLLDGCHLAHFDEGRPADDDLFAAFARPWREAFPEARIDRAAALAPVVDLVFQLDVFDRIAAATEPASAYELGGVVAWLLKRLPGAVAGLER